MIASVEKPSSKVDPSATGVGLGQMTVSSGGTAAHDTILVGLSTGTSVVHPVNKQDNTTKKSIIKAYNCAL
jgi:hypothetical protein